MKKSEIRVALDALKKLKLPKIEDKEMRNNIISIHFFLLKAQKELDSAIADAEKDYLDPYKDELRDISELQQKALLAKSQDEAMSYRREVQEHEDCNRAVASYNAEVTKILAEEIELPAKINHDSFIKNMENQDMGLDIQEALYPLFE